MVENGPSETARSSLLRQFSSDAQHNRLRLHFIQPEKPTQHAFIESFNGKLRKYCLNLHWFASLTEARAIIKRWRTHYNLSGLTDP